MLRVYFSTLFFIFASSIYSQTYTISDFQKVESASIDEMVVEDKLVGYYYFYAIENDNDKGSKKFILQLFNQDLIPTKKVEIKRPSYFQIVDIAFVEEGFVFLISEKPPMFIEKPIKIEEEIHSYSLDLTPIASSIHSLDIKDNTELFSKYNFILTGRIKVVGKNKFTCVIKDFDPNKYYNLSFKIVGENQSQVGLPLFDLRDDQNFYTFYLERKYLSGLNNPKFQHSSFINIIEKKSETIKFAKELKDESYEVMIIGGSIIDDKINLVFEAYDKKSHIHTGLLFKEYDLEGNEKSRVFVNEKTCPFADSLFKIDDDYKKNFTAELEYVGQIGNSYYFKRNKNAEGFNDIIIYKFDLSFKDTERILFKRTGHAEDRIGAIPNKRLDTFLSIGINFFVSPNPNELLFIYNEGGDKNGETNFTINVYSLTKKSIIKKFSLPGMFENYQFSLFKNTLISRMLDQENQKIEIKKFEF